MRAFTKRVNNHRRKDMPGDEAWPARSLPASGYLGGGEGMFAAALHAPVRTGDALGPGRRWSSTSQVRRQRGLA